LEEDIHYMQLSRLEDVFKAILKYDVEELVSITLLHSIQQI